VRDVAARLYAWAVEPKNTHQAAAVAMAIVTAVKDRGEFIEVSGVALCIESM
jgi:hypothetical protein